MKTSILLLFSISVAMVPAIMGQGGIDIVSPVVTSCPDDINVVSSSSPVTATWLPPTATDDRTSQANLKVYNTNNPGDAFNVGATQVTYVFEDEQGNSASCSFNVFVTQARKRESDELHLLEMALKSLLQDDEQLNEKALNEQAQNEQAQKENALKKKAMEEEEALVEKDEEQLNEMMRKVLNEMMLMRRDEEEINKMALKEDEEEQLNELALKENEEKQNEMLSEKKEATLYNLLHK